MSRKVDVDEREIDFTEKRLQHLANPWFQRLEVGGGLGTGRCAQGDATQSEQRGLFRRGDGAGVPDRVPEIESEIETRQDDVDLLPVIRTERDAVRRSAVHAECASSPSILVGR